MQCPSVNSALMVEAVVLPLHDVEGNEWLRNRFRALSSHHTFQATGGDATAFDVAWPTVIDSTVFKLVHRKPLRLRLATVIYTPSLALCPQGSVPRLCTAVCVLPAQRAYLPVTTLLPSKVAESSPGGLPSSPLTVAAVQWEGEASA